MVHYWRQSKSIGSLKGTWNSLIYKVISSSLNLIAKMIMILFGIIDLVSLMVDHLSLRSGHGIFNLLKIIFLYLFVGKIF